LAGSYYRKLALHEGIAGLATEQSKILPWMRQLRELTRTLKTLAELLKGFETEKVALAIVVSESQDEYTL